VGRVPGLAAEVPLDPRNLNLVHLLVDEGPINRNDSEI
jgi:hypothetical protein